MTNGCPAATARVREAPAGRAPGFDAIQEARKWRGEARFVPRWPGAVRPGQGISCLRG